MEFHIPLKAFASQCNSNMLLKNQSMSLKKRKKKAIMIPPPCTSYTPTTNSRHRIA